MQQQRGMVDRAVPFEPEVAAARVHVEVAVREGDEREQAERLVQVDGVLPGEQLLAEVAARAAQR